MRVNGVWFLFGAFFALSAEVYAQEAITGRVVDPTGSVLPGVIVKAVHDATGNSFQTATDEQGNYRVLVRTGTFTVRAELPGFQTVTQKVELLVDREVVLSFRLPVASQTESLTVTVEAPLVDVTTSRPTGNIDPAQVQELPLNGRNWMDLTLLAPGSRSNAVSESVMARDRGDSQINIDGQQISQNIQYNFGMPRFSKDAIAEFEFVANRFDATQGRSSGVQVNAVTKSGTNQFLGSAAGYFRNDVFNAADPINKTVLPYSDQQLSFTFGGPIIKDKLHFFSNYEYERQPQSFPHVTPYPVWNSTLNVINRTNLWGVRVDWQRPRGDTLMFRVNGFDTNIPVDPRYHNSRVSTPNGPTGVHRYMKEYFGTFTQVLSNRSVNQIKAGLANYHWVEHSPITNPFSQFHSFGDLGDGGAALQFSVPADPRNPANGFLVGQNHAPAPQRLSQALYSIRDDYSHTFSGHGQQTLKAGAEYLYHYDDMFFLWQGGGVIALRVPASVGNNLPAFFPNLFDATTWNLAALSPYVFSYSQSVGNPHFHVYRRSTGAWVQDDWQVTPNLTINLGLRYDFVQGLFAEQYPLPGVYNANRPTQKNNFGPRLGLARRLGGKTVIRSGFGRYYADVVEAATFPTASYNHQASLQIFPDPSSGFNLANFLQRPLPPVQEVLANECIFNNGAPGCVRRSYNQVAWPDNRTPYSYQASVGVQRELTSRAVISVDYSYIGERGALVDQPNVNLSYDPATGANKDFRNIATRPFPNVGTIGAKVTAGYSNYHGITTTITKRFSRRWQGTATHTWSMLKDSNGRPHSGFNVVPFKLASDQGDDYSFATTDQRNRSVFNGIVDVGKGFQLSGLYFFGSGMHFVTNWAGPNLRNDGLSNNGRLRSDGTIIPRNSLVGLPIHRVDMRLTKKFNLGERATIATFAEAFNLFNHENFGSYVTFVNNALFGQPSYNSNLAFQARMAQFGFRIEFRPK